MVDSHIANNSTEALVKTSQVAFARVFSGTLKKGQTLFALSPRYEPTTDNTEVDKLLEQGLVKKFSIGDLYLLMGKELEFLDEVPAGSVCGIGGMENLITKSGTISSTLACPSFTDMHMEAMPIVRVAIEPVQPSDTTALIEGMKLLNQADPCVQTLIQKTGENVLIAAGEVHLQKCIDDLKERYARIELNVSDPIVPFRESIVPPPKIDMADELVVQQKVKTEDADVISPGVVRVQIPSPSGSCTLKIRVVPLSSSLCNELERSSDLIKLLVGGSRAAETDYDTPDLSLKLDVDTLKQLTDLRQAIEKEFTSFSRKFVGFSDKIWAFGPNNIGPNFLVNNLPDYKRISVWQPLDDVSGDFELRDFDSCIVNGFQLACGSGPICEEPVMGVCFIVEEWSYEQSLETDETSLSLAGFSGSLMYCMKESCRKALQSYHPRLMLPMYSCQIQATADVLGKLYAVLGQRNAQVLSTEMKESSNMFLVDTVIPVVESFGLAEDVRKKTSGLAGIQLKFSHWEVLDIDPYWTPTTDEEMALFGDKAERENAATRYMNQVRRRKGLKTSEKLVEFGEKQRTLTKNK